MYNLGCPPSQDSSHHQDSGLFPIFLLGNPEKNLHLPLASWEGRQPNIYIYNHLFCHWGGFLDDSMSCDLPSLRGSFGVPQCVGERWNRRGWNRRMVTTTLNTKHLCSNFFGWVDDMLGKSTVLNTSLHDGKTYMLTIERLHVWMDVWLSWVSIEEMGKTSGALFACPN